MNRLALSLFILIGFSFSPVAAQPPTTPQLNGQDYFSADKSPGSYASIVEKNHVLTVPNWIKQGRLDNALGDIKYTLDRFPNHLVSLQQLSTVAQMIKNTSLAVNYFERAVTLYPQYALTRAQYGLYLVSVNNIDAGIEKLLQSTEMEPTLAAGYVGLAYAYSKKGDLEHAREAAQKARELGFIGKLPAGL